MKRRRYRLARLLIAIGAILSGLVALAEWAANRPASLRHAASIALLGSGWRFDVDKFKWDVLASEIAAEGISLSNAATGSSIAVGSARVSYKPLGLMRGSLVVSGLEVAGVRGRFIPTPRPPEARRPRRINVARLLLLKRLDLRDGRIEGIEMDLGRGRRLIADEARLTLAPKFFGDTSLGLKASGLLFDRGDGMPAVAQAIELDAATDLAKWESELPYVNAIEGAVKAAGLGFRGLLAEEAGARASFEDGSLKLTDLSVTMGGGRIEGSLSARSPTEEFDLALSAPRPIALPFIVRPMETIATAGELSGKVSLKGRGFDPMEAKAKGRIEISYRFDASPAAPVSLAVDVEVGSGRIMADAAAVKAGEDGFTARGMVDLKRKEMELSAEGSGFPLEHIFDKFTNPHLAKIFGPTDFKGTVEGWGKGFVAKVEGVTRGGGWRPITADRAEMTLDATYDRLKLDGRVFSAAGEETGRSSLTVKFGAKGPDGKRRKDIELTADADGQPLAESLSAYGLGGTGRGRVWIRGPHTSFKGEAEAKIEGGAWHGLPFESAEALASLSRKKIVFSAMRLKLPDVRELEITGELIGDVEEGRFGLHGTPMPGLSVTASYRYSDSRWLIKGIAWEDPHDGSNLAASGSIVSGGAVDLRIAGRADLKLAEAFATLVKSASGPASVDLNVRGSTSDPRPFGTIALEGARLSPRTAAITLEDLKGALRFSGGRISFEGVEAGVDDGSLAISGHLDHRGFDLSSAALSIACGAMRYRSADGALRLEFDGALNLDGAFPNPLLRGDLTVLDGRYTKDFTIIGAISGARRKERARVREAEIVFDPRLDLRIRNSGDLAIRNNVGDIWLNADIAIKGTRKAPIVSGAIDTAEGRIHYLGLEFDITKGFVEFRERYAAPHIEVHAQKEVGAYNVDISLHGPTDNLALDLSATSPSGFLEKRDVVSLLLFGATEQEREAMARQAGGALAASVVGQAVTGFIEQPVLKLTHLDVFRLEAAEAGEGIGISRVSLGKQISDRLTVKFATDVNTTNAIQTFVGEYMVTDNLIVTGQRSSDANYKINGALRFRLR